MIKLTRFTKRASCIVLLALLSNAAFAQEEYFKLEEPEKKTGVRGASEEAKKETSVADFQDQTFVDKIRLGGSAGLRFGTFTNINLSPTVGLALSENFTVAAGPAYIYVRDSYFIPSSSASFFGARAFARYHVVPMVHLQAEYELMNVEFYNHGFGKYQNVSKTFARTWLQSPMIGIGYSQPVGGKFVRGVHATLLYNLNYNNHINPSINYDFYHPGTQMKNISHYASPIVFRVSIL